MRSRLLSITFIATVAAGLVGGSIAVSPFPVAGATQDGESSQVAISAVVAAARQYRQEHEREILAEFLEFLSIPNVASDSENIRRSAEWILAALKLPFLGDS